jgi:3-hydroxyacyl-CoA dehydrogenase
MKRRIDKVAVLGAGTMGSRIAAHLANAGVSCVLLDIVPPNLPVDSPAAARNKIVAAGLDAAKKSRPAAFFTASLADRITIGNFEDDLARCAEADWIIEVVAENLDIKRKLLSRVAEIRKAGCMVTTNTSGLPVHLIAEGMSDEFQQHWAGTHFFNPPRYLKLVELIPGPKTSAEVIAALTEFCDRRLGKGVVVAKDTPNFIANRIGTFSMLNALRLMSTLGMTIEEVDACTGPVIGQPKSATFRTADIVGLDVLLHVVNNIYESVPNDESREMYKAPALVEEMARRKWLGDKTGQGFYKRVKGEGEKEILTLDVNTMEYRPRQKARLASLDAAKGIDDTRERLGALLGPVLAGHKGATILVGLAFGNMSVRGAALAGDLRQGDQHRSRDALGIRLGTRTVRSDRRAGREGICRRAAETRPFAAAGDRESFGQRTQRVLRIRKRRHDGLRLSQRRHQNSGRTRRHPHPEITERRFAPGGTQLRRQFDRSGRRRRLL